jgi:hypothetical protein
MQKELSMTRTQEALLLASVLIAIALLAVFDIIPQAIARYAPLAVVPLIVLRQRSCGKFGKEQRA